jgi:hypothetical protein
MLRREPSMCYEVRKPQTEIDLIAMDAYRMILQHLFEAKTRLAEHLLDPEMCFPRRLSDKQLWKASRSLNAAIEALDGFKPWWLRYNLSTDEINKGDKV